MTAMEEAERNASVEGVDPFDTIKAAVVKLRGRTLDDGRIGEAVLLTHAVWWLSELRHKVERADAAKSADTSRKVAEVSRKIDEQGRMLDALGRRMRRSRWKGNT